jgi:glycerate 2-kinase
VNHEVALKDATPIPEKKQFIRRLFAETMAAVELGPAMASSISLHHDGTLGALSLGSDSFPLSLFSQVLVIAVGKAAVPMAEYMQRILEPWRDEQHQVEGFVVGSNPWKTIPGWTYFEGAHPLPGTNSFAASKLLLDRMQSADERTLALFLISGGSSSMLELPLSPTIPHPDVITFYRALVHAGLPIAKMNVLRKHLSRVKGGRLAAAGAKATKATVLISDVPSGMLDVVGSGLSLPDPSTLEDFWRILDQTPHLRRELPESILNFLPDLPETPKEIPAGVLPSACLSLLSSESLTDAASRIAAAEGYRVVVDNTCDDWDYREAAQYLADRLRAEQRHGGSVCLLSAGEVTVSVSGKHGIGGRNQQWALEVVRNLQNESASYVVLSAGSDGVDGNSPAAGAVADRHTWARARAMGLDPARALLQFDTYPLFDRLADTIVTGPLGNNLRDLRILLSSE